MTSYGGPGYEDNEGMGIVGYLAKSDTKTAGLGLGTVREPARSRSVTSGTAA